ncbi:hypothetical protein FOXYS1_14344 [Fusarium oxysporum]|uniref:Glutamine amidotransferase n=1 Tax=Fusarium oxysporum TaxID=5507 RepID=A0A8H5EC48_FUSOX|nr:hypothetical protein FOXYS1_14344 [Fusarium oxysporum]
MRDESYPTPPLLGNQGIPRILVTGSLTPPGASNYLVGVIKQLSNTVISAIQRTKADIIHVDVSAPGPRPIDALRRVDGLLVLGGADIDPTYYGQVPQADNTYGTHPKANKFELTVLGAAIARDLPVLGICRGMQLLNIAYGGDMVQDIGPGTVHNSDEENAVMVTHPVSIEPETHPQTIYGNRTLAVRSGHHQAVSRVGEELRAAAYAEDGMVEAMEGRNRRWVVGVQWHPEDSGAPQEDLDLLITEFCQEARIRLKAN